MQGKANVVSEKATIDRQLKALQAQTGKLTKVLNSFTEHVSSPRATHMACCLHEILIWQSPYLQYSKLMSPIAANLCPGLDHHSIHSGCSSSA